MDIELLKNTQVVIGVILGLFGIFSTLILWLDRRQKSFATSAVAEATRSSNSLAAKVDFIDEEVDAVARDVSAVKSDLNALSTRVHGIEKSMETVARQSDLSALNAEVKSLSGAVTTELRVLSSTMHSFQVAALRAAEKRDKT